MSALPPPYYPEESFATIAEQPIVTAGLPGSELDQEFGNIQSTVNAVRSRLSEIQRDDGQLRNGIVGFEALAPEIVQFAIASKVRLRGPWTPSTIYVFDGTTADVYTHLGQTRIVAVSYMSGATFGALDEAVTGLLGTPPNIGTIVRDVFAGDGTETIFTMSQDPISPTNVHVYVDGLNQLVDVDFTIAGAVVTFASPPANAAVIVTEVGTVSEIEINTVADGAITAAKLANGSVTEGKLATGGVTTTKVADGAITTAKLATGAVTAAKLENGAVGESQIGLGAVVAAKIADGAVSSAKIASGAVGSAQLALGSVVPSTIADMAVNAAKIAADAVTTAKILDANVSTAKLADGAVTTVKIADANITPAKLTGAQTGTAPIYGARAWATIDGVTAANKTGTYTQTLTVVTVTVTAHGLRVGHAVWCDFTSGGATDAEFVVDTVIDANNFTVTRTTATTSGNVTLNFVTITASGNISSVAKIGTGDLAVNFTVDMPSANYAMQGSAIAYSATIALSNVALKGTGASAYAGPIYRRTASTVSILTSASNNNSLVDMKEASLLFIA